MRKGTPKKKILLPDPKYKETLVTRFVNNLMKSGKKNLALTIFYKSLDLVQEKTNEPGLEVWKKALNNVFPTIEVKRRRIGGATIQVPVEVWPDRKISLGIKWLLEQARLRNERTMQEKLANEIIAASQGEGKTVKKKSDTHKMAESNRAFSHLKI
jgi:small subunit ribosomal protein S7